MQVSLTPDGHRLAGQVTGEVAGPDRPDDQHPIGGEQKRLAQLLGKILG